MPENKHIHFCALPNNCKNFPLYKMEHGTNSPDVAQITIVLETLQVLKYIAEDYQR